jgi:hypothetical protein
VNCFTIVGVYDVEALAAPDPKARGAAIIRAKAETEIFFIEYFAFWWGNSLK